MEDANKQRYEYFYELQLNGASAMIYASFPLKVPIPHARRATLSLSISMPSLTRARINNVFFRLQ
jgi:hypothetical protein